MQAFVVRAIISRLKESRHVVAVVLSLLLFTAALWVLHRELTGIHLSDVLVRFASVEPSAVVLALLFTTASYLALIGYDALALRYVGHPLPYHRVALTSFIATAVGHNLGVAMVGLTFGIGVTFVAALALALSPAEAAPLLNVSETWRRPSGSRCWRSSGCISA